MLREYRAQRKEALAAIASAQTRVAPEFSRFRKETERLNAEVEQIRTSSNANWSTCHPCTETILRQGAWMLSEYGLELAKDGIAKAHPAKEGARTAAKLVIPVLIPIVAPVIVTDAHSDPELTGGAVLGILGGMLGSLGLVFAHPKLIDLLGSNPDGVMIMTLFSGAIIGAGICVLTEKYKALTLGIAAATSAVVFGVASLVSFWKQRTYIPEDVEAELRDRYRDFIPNVQERIKWTEISAIMENIVTGVEKKIEESIAAMNGAVEELRQKVQPAV